jgi:methionyl-tRNA formyltransferase
MATYDPLCRDEHAAVTWDRPVAEVYDLIRGCDPQPGAFTRIGNRMLRLHDAGRAAGEREAPPGTVIRIDETGMCVATRGGSVRVRRMRADGERAKTTAAELATAIGLQAGAVLG